MKFIEKHPIIMIVIGVLGISMSAIFVKYSAAPSGVTAAYRLLWTVALMTPAVLGKRETRGQLRRTDRKTVWLSILSGLFLAVHFVLWFESLAHTTVAASTTIVCTEVIWVAIGFAVFMKGHISWRAVLAIAVTFGGSAVIAWGDMGSGMSLYGDLLALVSAVSVAMYTLLGRVVRKNTTTTVYTYICYLACAASLLGFTLLRGQDLFAYGWSAPIVGLLLAVFSTVLGHSIFSWCLRFFSPAFVSASKLCEPVVAALFAAILFSEIPGVAQWIGAVLILGGVLYYSYLETHPTKR